MRSFIISVACGTALLLGACSKSSTSAGPGLHALEIPVAGHVTAPRLAGDYDGNLVLSWLAPGPDGDALQFARYVKNHWSPAATVVANVEMFVNWADLPSVVPLNGNRVAAHWLVKRPENVYSYDVAVAQSTNRGATWSAPISPHDDGTPTEHGFVSIFPHENKTGLLWLDGRKMVGKKDAANPAATGMTLRAAFVDAEQLLSEEQLVDDLTCDCCQTDVAVAASGPIAVYRDRTAEEIRDIAVTRYVNGAWQPGRTIAADNWEIAACPVNGPAIVAGGQFVAVAWFTSAETPAVRVSVSSDSGETFSKPIDVIVGDTLGRVGLAQLDRGDVAVSWLQSNGNQSTTVLVRRVARDGSLGPIVTVATAAALLAVPQIARIRDELIFAWTETHDGDPSIASARLPFTALMQVN
ncbi:MAG: hypothetical protein OER22_09705 [Gammaproteobacteria bacterium]|nr:hypothetical protein [Gammaproteobacteria bacterium]MDH3374453.1 hypothetical protein [Gammaproteobacteria bacterium]MDH3408171.1 hypothetical protein [Gammaproteobacteria bacterium]MDH3552875.1 hypothetical protein [Gammaproteobacteria bacterium]